MTALLSVIKLRRDHHHCRANHATVKQVAFLQYGGDLVGFKAFHRLHRNSLVEIRIENLTDNAYRLNAKNGQPLPIALLRLILRRQIKP